jgi:hypothetical protein
LWKRGATKNLGFAFVNTHRIETVKEVEEAKAKKKFGGNSYDAFGTDWEYIDNSDDVLLYHGFKDKKDMEDVVDYLMKVQSK